uniref:Uncharacterized protein n=1 Tax=Branchiostoma floridae TaxID=7739 RepID=C3Y5H8_BRAFL|eukprot:XP_002608215.1 hypothetical protein BRAFLDRAFT_87866 [Branchiostoma floridae]
MYDWLGCNDGVMTTVGVTVAEGTDDPKVSATVEAREDNGSTVLKESILYDGLGLSCSDVADAVWVSTGTVCERKGRSEPDPSKSSLLMETDDPDDLDTPRLAVAEGTAEELCKMDAGIARDCKALEAGRLSRNCNSGEEMSSTVKLEVAIIVVDTGNADDKSTEFKLKSGMAIIDKDSSRLTCEIDCNVGDDEMESEGRISMEVGCTAVSFRDKVDTVVITDVGVTVICAGISLEEKATAKLLELEKAALSGIVTAVAAGVLTESDTKLPEGCKLSNTDNSTLELVLGDAVDNTTDGEKLNTLLKLALKVFDGSKLELNSTSLNSRAVESTLGEIAETNATLGLTVSCGLTAVFELMADVSADCVDISDGEDGTMVRVLADEKLPLKVKLGNTLVVVCFRSTPTDNDGVDVTGDISKTEIVGDGSSIVVVPDILDLVSAVAMVLAKSELPNEMAEKSTLLSVGINVGDKAL